MSKARQQSRPGGGYLHRRPGGREGEFEHYTGPMGEDTRQRGEHEGQGRPGRRERGEGEDARQERGEE